ncbi:non-classical arabinogalactan protein 30-like [Dioscorea cayenensis subsp. rotundata]|uniref:Non-classical arabinogalactan protein 30-like n=1 Tax=Dioscorea cayennensis subsp. rotundata TaxID=55577 RepID=A0AB40AM65_DIOCR|nr:non-classical arabinogalactan protein 30-like [Dioscorea cayenensis subsp. rotundata]
MVPIRSKLALKLLVLFLTIISFNVVVLGVASKHPSPKHPSPPPAPVPAIPAPAIPVPPALPPTIITPSPPPPPPFSVVSTIIKPSPPPPPPFSVPPIGKLLISVEGVVYCQFCKFPGYDKVLNASPLRGALAKLVCYNKKEKHGVVVTTKTDRKGYFLIQSYKLSGFQARSCKVVVTSPLKVCSKLVHPGLPLRFERVVNMGKRSANFAVS